MSADNIDQLRRKLLELADAILVLAVIENPKLALELPINILTNTAFRGYVWCRRDRSKQECMETVVGFLEESTKSAIENLKKLLDEADQFENLDDIKLGMLLENMKEESSKYNVKIL